jgi:preprotein translocase subunit SecY
VAVIAFIVFVERAQRRLLIQYPKRQVGNRMFGATVASAAEAEHRRRDPADLRLVAAAAADHAVAGFSNTGRGRIGLTTPERRCSAAASRCSCDLYRGLIVFFAFFYTAIVFNPKDTADNLKRMAASFRASGRASARRSTSTTC